MNTFPSTSSSARRVGATAWIAASLAALFAAGPALPDVPRTEPVSSCCSKGDVGARAGDGSRSRYESGIATYNIPGLVLVDQDGRKVPLAELLARDRAVAVNFIFTTCRTICPVLSTTLSNLRRELGAGSEGLTLVSISIDPEYDSPSVLKSYAARFAAGPEWRFLTGTTEDIAIVQKAFDAYVGDKMSHRPLTFLKPAGSDRWVRLDGFPKSAELVAEWQRLATRG